VTIGSYFNNTNWLSGKFDQIRFFNTDIDQTAVDELFAEEYGDATVSTTDFGGYGGFALYELDEDANDTGGSFGSLYTTNRELDLDVDGYTSGSVSDLSGNSYTATLNGNTTYGTDSNGGGYFDFDGTSDYLSIDQTISNSFSGDFTLEFIIEPHETGNFTYVYAKQNASTNGLLIGNFAGSNSNIEIYRYNTSGTNILTGNFTSTGITADEWQHIAIVFSATTAKLYRNGSQVSSTITGSAATYPADFTEFYIGGNYSSSFDLNGRVGDFRVHSSALSDSQVLQNFYASKGEYGVGYDGTPTNVNFLGMAFQPDLVWQRYRTISYDHYIMDSVRGGGKYLSSNNSNQENNLPNAITFDSNGFTIGGSPFDASLPQVAWCWKASDTTVTDSSTGTQTTNYRANQEAGFSIVEFVGGSGANYVPHGLAQAPELFIMKSVNVSGNWGVYVKDLGADKYLVLNSNASAATSTGVWNDTHPDSTFLHWQGGLIAAGGTGQYNNIAYCFHSVDGYQRIGIYTGASGLRVYTDSNGDGTGTGAFQPRFLMVKKTTSANWVIIDSVRVNGIYEDILFPNTTDAEAAGNYDELTFNSDGFTWNQTENTKNAVGGEYIYLAIA
jgi:hypothetical protein